MRKKSETSASLIALASPKRVVLLGLPPVDALDVIGPAEVFTWANHLREGDAALYELVLICPGSEAQMESETGIGLKGHGTIEQESRSGRQIDTLLVATGSKAYEEPDAVAVEWIRTRSRGVRRICSICVGAFALAAAGLLEGRRATTHWGAARRLAEQYPEVRVDPLPIWIKDGNVYTSAGVSSGIDLALALVSEDFGNDFALEIAKNLVLFLRRPARQAQFSFALQSQVSHDSTLDELCLWIGDHLHVDLTVEIMAARVSTSTRTLIRMFQRELGTTPGKYVENLRLESVCRSLALGDKSMHEICRQNGYSGIEVLRKAFRRRYGITPKEYAEGFCAG